jgi:hypothetical protein
MLGKILLFSIVHTRNGTRGSGLNQGNDITGLTVQYAIPGYRAWTPGIDIARWCNRPANENYVRISSENSLEEKYGKNVLPIYIR